PFSSLIAAPKAEARDRMAALSARVIPRSSAEAVTSLAATDSEAAPARCRQSAQKNWSPTKGTTTDGTPARTAEWLVPDPPWWMTIDARGNSQSCGVSPRVRKLAGRSDASTPLQPG